MRWSGQSREEDAVAGSKLWQVYGTAAAIGSTIVARKLVDRSWHVATGNTPPKNPESPDVTMAEALAWAVASGVAVGVARMLAARKAADYWRRSTGSLPPGLEEVG